VNEFELIRRHFFSPNDAAGVVTGIGDDGAVVEPEPGRELIVVIDTLVEGIHFLAATDPEDIGYRAVAVNLSDIAAMGGRPRWMTLALTLRDASDDWVGQFARGLRAAAAEHDVALIGGDTTQGNCVVVSVQITGDVDSGTAILRSRASPGDTIFVTGSVGDAAGGLELLRDGRPDPYLSGRFLRPTARIEYGQSLTGIATAAIDISDGLFADLQKLLSASGYGGEIDLNKLPVSAELKSCFDDAAVRRLALCGGDDYELCFTANPDDLPDAGDLPVTAIGRVTASKGLITFAAGSVVDFSDTGYLHFK
jgi:thiamine-monophosphate kinase